MLSHPYPYDLCPVQTLTKIFISGLFLWIHRHNWVKYWVFSTLNIYHCLLSCLPNWLPPPLVDQQNPNASFWHVARIHPIFASHHGNLHLHLSTKGGCISTKPRAPNLERDADHGAQHIPACQLFQFVQRPDAKKFKANQIDCRFKILLIFASCAFIASIFKFCHEKRL